MNYKEETTKSYNKHAEHFSEYFKGLFNLEKRTEFKEFMNLLSGKKVLDIGCGDGEHSSYFQNQGLNVTCIDISEEMIKICKKKKLNAQVMDIENLIFKPDSFDGIWAVTSLLHIKKSNLLNVIKNIHKVLKEKGILYVCVKEGEGEKLIQDKHDKETKRFFSFWKKEEMLKILENYFDLIKFENKKVGSTTYLQFFLRKNFIHRLQVNNSGM